jgi:NAD(P)-dependent dehydrogenase (short-subunit alcohol dehydrogenase family)
MAITGTGSGFGSAICREASIRGFKTLSIGRGHSDFSDFQITLDLAKAETVSKATEEMGQFDISVVLLNAFKFGAIGSAREIPIGQIQENLQVNLYSQKKIIDSALRSDSVTEVIAISSGAAKTGYAGWLHYCVGKASLDSMLRVYAKEIPSVKFWSASPGVLKGGLNQTLLETEGDYEWKEKLKGSSSPPSHKASSLLDLVGGKTPSSGDWVKL